MKASNSGKARTGRLREAREAVVGSDHLGLSQTPSMIVMRRGDWAGYEDT